MLGAVKVYSDTQNFKDFVSRMAKLSNEHEDDDDNTFKKVDCIDDQLPLMGGKDELVTDDNGLFQEVATLIYGEHFGGLDLKSIQKRSVQYYVSDSACQLAVLTQNVII